MIALWAGGVSPLVSFLSPGEAGPMCAVQGTIIRMKLSVETRVRKIFVNIILTSNRYGSGKIGEGRAGNLVIRSRGKIRPYRAPIALFSGPAGQVL